MVLALARPGRPETDTVGGSGQRVRYGEFGRLGIPYLSDGLGDPSKPRDYALFPQKINRSLQINGLEQRDGPTSPGFRQIH